MNVMWNNLKLSIKGIKDLGLKESLRRIYRTSEVKYLRGDFVGKDTFGNEYYLAKSGDGTVFGRERWVIYNNKDYDATQIPPEWHQWMHHLTDQIPTEEYIKVRAPKYQKPYHMNMTGTDNAYTSKYYLRNENYKKPEESWVYEEKK